MVTVTGKGNYKDTAQASWHMTEKVMTVNHGNIHVEYDGKPHGIEVQVVDPASNAVIKYGEYPGVYDLSESPTLTDGGDKTVYFKVTAPNYVDYEASTTIWIMGGPAPEQPTTEQPVMSETEPTPADVSPEKKSPAKIELSSRYRASNSGGVVTIKWGKVTGATNYAVYATYCRTSKCIKLGEVTKTSFSFSKLNK